MCTCSICVYAYNCAHRYKKLGYATRGVPYVSCSRILQSRIFRSRIFNVPIDRLLGLAYSFILRARLATLRPLLAPLHSSGCDSLMRSGELAITLVFAHTLGWCRVGIAGEPPPPFMSTDAHFWVKIGLKFQPMCKISNISTSDPRGVQRHPRRRKMRHRNPWGGQKYGSLGGTNLLFCFKGK